MAFPTLADVTDHSDATDASSYNITMPATVNAGDLLLMFASLRTASTPSMTGWTAIEIFSSTDYLAMCLFGKVADGTEGGTTPTLSAGGTSRYCFGATARISNGTWGGTLASVEAAQADFSTTGDAPTLTPSWGESETLWLVADRDNTGGPNFVPSGYTEETNLTNPDASFEGSAEFTLSSLEELTASESPGTTASAGPHCIFTVGVDMIAPVYDLHAYQMFNDDGSELLATKLGSESERQRFARELTKRLRAGIAVENDPLAETFKLQYRRKGDVPWNDVTT